MNLRALSLRALDLLKSFGAPPYCVRDNQEYDVEKSIECYSLAKALRVADATHVTTKDGHVFYIWVNDVELRFTRDRFGRLHLPRALRERIL